MDLKEQSHIGLHTTAFNKCEAASKIIKKKHIANSVMKRSNSRLGNIEKCLANVLLMLY